MPGLLAAGLADQGRRIGVAELQDDVLIPQGGQGVQQVVDVEADRQAIDLGVGSATSAVAGAVSAGATAGNTAIESCPSGGLAAPSLASSLN